MGKYSKLKIVNDHLDYDNVSLIEPTDHFYIHIAVEIDNAVTPFYFKDSSLKKKIIKETLRFSEILRTLEGLISIDAFKALLVPPGRGKYIEENADKIKKAKFDFALLIELKSKDDMSALIANKAYNELVSFLNENAKAVHIISATNSRRIGPVDHDRQGVFLFNYFFADDVEQNLQVWNYTAGWFEKETKLDNSTLLMPINSEESNYFVINHCRWDKLTDIIPSLIFKPTFRKYVLANFYENKVGAMPILYKLIK